MTIDQLVIYREKIRSVSVPEAVHYLLGEIDRFMDENARLTAELAEAKTQLELSATISNRANQQIKTIEAELAEAKEYIRQLEMGHGNKEVRDERHI